VLVNAKKASAGTASAAPANCSSTASGEAYELSGNREKELTQYVGRAVEITGTLKPAKTEPGPAGAPKPTGGVDPLKQDLKLFEVEITSFRPVSAQAAAPAAPAPQASAPPAAQAPASPATPPSEQSASAASRQDLPRTASPLPLMGLLGLLSFATGVALRRRA
jgi:hypothetical protein